MSHGKFAVPAALAFAGVLAACGLVRDEGVSARCADMVSAAWPDGVDIATRRASVEDNAETAEVTGTADGNEIAARCRFEHDVLADFQWLSGPAATGASGSSMPPPEGGGHQ
ncbi:MAG TPA: hypothetical protein VLV50_20040 [Stellaceae bacterium]|nr:hypothetical protein [Stellaceae bacterium]